MKRLALIFPVLLLTLLVGNPGFSADLQKGLDAYKKGDYATALKELTPLAEQGNVYAQDNLGKIYMMGDGVLQHYKTAVKWYRLAAEQGYADAQHSLSYMYGSGLGVPRNYTLAYMWSNIAASQGNKDARYNRITFEKKLTPAQIETAQRLARECVEKNYKGC